MEWSLDDGQFMVKNQVGMTTPFPQLNQMKLELSHNTEWDAAQLSETKASLIIDRQKYTFLLKGIYRKTHARKDSEVNVIMRIV